jgi:hypothetical protein
MMRLTVETVNKLFGWKMLPKISRFALVSPPKRDFFDSFVGCLHAQQANKDER